MNPNDHSNDTGSAGGKRPPKPPPVPHGPGRASRAPLLWLRNPPTWAIIAAFVTLGLGGVFCVVVLTLALLMVNQRETPPVQIAESAAELDAHDPSETAELAGAVPREDSSRSIDMPWDKPSQEPVPDVSPEVLSDWADQEPSETPSVPVAAAFQDIRSRQNRLRLPPLTVTEGVGVFAKPRLNTEVVELAKIDVQDSAELDLQLGGSEFQPRRERNQYVVEPRDENHVRRWEIATHVPTALGGVAEVRRVATFTLQDGALCFNWETEQPPFRLPFCTLTLTAYGHSETCHFEWISDPAAGIQLTNEAPARYDLPGVSRLSLRPDDEVFLEVKFPGLPGADFGENRSTLTCQENEAAICIPLESYLSKTADSEISIRLSLNREEDREFIRALWIESTPVGPAPFMEQTEQILGEHWKSAHWKRIERLITLSDDSVENHWKTQNKLEDQLRRFGDYCRLKHGYALIARWADEPTTLRRSLVGEYAELEAEIHSIGAGLVPLHAAFAGLQKERAEEKRREALQNLEDIIEQNRQQAEKLTEAHDALRREREGLIAKQPELPEVYKRYRLDQPQYLELASTYNFFRDYLDELESWHVAVNRFVTDLRNNGRLEYRLYVTIDGREIDLLITEGFPDQASDAADAD